MNHSRSRRTVPQLRRVTGGVPTVAEFEAAQAFVLSALPSAELLAPTTHEEWVSYLRGGAIVVAAMLGDELAGYGTAMTATQVDETRSSLASGVAARRGLAEEDCGWVDTIAVLPAFRGLGLQRKIADELLAALNGRGCRHVLTTVAPTNEHSMRNFIALGYKIIDTVRIYGGRTRHILLLE